MAEYFQPEPEPENSDLVMDKTTESADSHPETDGTTELVVDLESLAQKIDALAQRQATDEEVFHVFVTLPFMVLMGVSALTFTGISASQLSPKINELVYNFHKSKGGDFLNAFFVGLLSYGVTAARIDAVDERVSDRIRAGAVGFMGSDYKRSIRTGEMPVSTHVLPAMAKTARALASAIKKVRS